MKTNNIRVGAALMVRNMGPLIRHAIRSLRWVDAIYLFDDNSSDDTATIATSAASVPIHIEHSHSPLSAFERGERTIRNYVLNRAFEETGSDFLVLLDGDEIMLPSLKQVIAIAADGGYDSVSVTIWHLFDPTRYIAFRETTINGIFQIDPHVRVVSRGITYQDLIVGDESHPMIPVTSQTYVEHGFHHFHLRYAQGSPFENNSLFSLPADLSEKAVEPFLRTLPRPLPLFAKRVLAGMNLETAARKVPTQTHAHRRGLVDFVNYDCTQFLGASPCAPHLQHGHVCPSCPEYQVDAGQRILIIDTSPDSKLEMSFIPERLKSAYHGCKIWYICNSNADIEHLSATNIDTILPLDIGCITLLLTMDFHLAINLSNDQVGAQLIALARAPVKRGSAARSDGKIIPLSIGSYHRYQSLMFPNAAQLGEFSVDALLAETCDVDPPLPRD